MCSLIAVACMALAGLSPDTPPPPKPVTVKVLPYDDGHLLWEQQVSLQAALNEAWAAVDLAVVGQTGDPVQAAQTMGRMLVKRDGTEAVYEETLRSICVKYKIAARYDLRVTETLDKAKRPTYRLVYYPVQVGARSDVSVPFAVALTGPGRVVRAAGR